MVNFLKRLFPKLENTIYDYEWLGEWRKNRRICSSDVFDIYFRLSLPSGEISREEMETILSLGNNSKSFSEALLKLNKDGIIVRFLERMEDYTENDIPTNNIEPIISVLMDIGDIFPIGDSSLVGIDTPMRLLRIFFQLSQRFKTHDERFEIFQKAMVNAKQSIYTIVHEVSVQDLHHGKYTKDDKPEPEEKRTVTSDQLEKLEKIVLGKIKQWEEDGKLAEHKHLTAILYRWKQWGDEKEVRAFVEKIILDDIGLIKFISGFLGERSSQGFSDYVAKTESRIHLDEISEFIDVKDIEPRIRGINNSNTIERFSEKEQLAVKIFLDTFDGKIKSRF